MLELIQYALDNCPDVLAETMVIYSEDVGGAVYYEFLNLLQESVIKENEKHIMDLVKKEECNREFWKLESEE